MRGSGDYISREAAREAVWQILNGMGYSEKHNDRLVEEVDAVFDDIPAADVRPVVKAHWKPGDIRNVSAVCSNCGHLRLGNGAEWATKLAYFCEKCGAYMRPEPPKEGET